MESKQSGKEVLLFSTDYRRKMKQENAETLQLVELVVKWGNKEIAVSAPEHETVEYLKAYLFSVTR